MVNGGPTYTQVIEFEVLDSTDWPTGASFITYLTTRRAYQDSYVGTSVTVATLHRLIDEISKKIERWTGRFFDPRYLKYVTEGKASARLLLPEAIVAIEDMYAIWRTSSGNDSYKYEQYLYKVYNRHLDGYSIEDDRHNPRIDLTDVDGNVVEVSDFCWPYGSQNIEVRGVFGFTDVDADYTGGQISVGHTPRDIARVVGSLAYRYTQDPTLSNPTVFSAGNIVSMRTRDQSVTFGGSSSSSSSGAGSSASDMTGDPTLDRILSRFCAPIALGAV